MPAGVGIEFIGRDAAVGNVAEAVDREDLPLVEPFEKIAHAVDDHLVGD